MSRNDPDQHPDDYPDEPMTGWDTPEDLETDLSRTQLGPGHALLVTLNTYLVNHGPTDENHTELNQARLDLIQAMRNIDWNALDFALNATKNGEDLWSCHPGHDVLTKYTPRGRRDPAQQEFAF
jgi:hypothetical protein